MKLSIAIGAWLGSAITALAWGPHPQITALAVASLPEDAPIREILGSDDLARLANYTWMADWGESYRDEGEVAYYPNDYLIYPPFAYHPQHLMPQVADTWGPFFQQAVWALNSQDSRNAARWVGSLLHFVTDTGSPPHSIGLLGPLHGPMENWLDGDALKIGDYQPQALGHDLSSALEGLETRMRGLVEFSAQRAEPLKALIEAEDRTGAEPMITECAEETARVTADLLLTLGIVAAAEAETRTPADSADWTLEIESTAVAGFEKMPARVMLVDSHRATIADADGHATFRRLPPGNYRAIIARHGSSITISEVTLEPGQQHKSSVTLNSSGGNLLRYGEIGRNVRWSSADRPEGWQSYRRRGQPARLTNLKGWSGEPIRVTAGETITVASTWKDPSAPGRVMIEWATNAGRGSSYVEAQPALSASGSTENEFTVPDGMGAARITLLAPGTPDSVLEQITVRR